jgi:exosome complex component CSL4
LPILSYIHNETRLNDVRETGEDIPMHHSFRPGDIIRAQIISLGDAELYYVTTAKNELGVIIAESQAGSLMIPISWQAMLCPKTQRREFRKCAKPWS